MKYTSEITKLSYNSPEECLKAEADYEKEQKRIKEELAKAVAEKKAKEEALNKSKKEMASSIEEASKELTEANNLYDVAKEKAVKILEDSNKEVKQLLDAAGDKVREAEEKRLNAVIAFNKKFGTYTTTLTGDRATQEYKRTINEINNTFRNVLKDIFLF